MKNSAVAVAGMALVFAGCGDGNAIEQADESAALRLSMQSASDAQRQAALDACKPPYTGPNGKGGRLTQKFCGVMLPKNGADRTPQRWWDAAGCLADHPEAFSQSCKDRFEATCGNGDQCICDDGEKLDEDDQCVPADACDNDDECDAVANGTAKCSDTVEHDPSRGHCVTTCNSGFVFAKGRCVPVTACVPTSCAAQGKNCGTIADGCGGSVTCGTCTSPLTCGGGGTANVCGTSALPALLTITPPARDFGALTLAASSEATFTVTNSGGSPTGALSKATLAGANASEFSVSADGCAAKALAAGAACTVTVRFTPTSAGAKTALLSVTGTPGGAATAALTGTGTAQCVTRVSGTVFAPTKPVHGAPDPIYGALVYIATGPVQPFAPGAACESCTALISGNPAVSAMTGPDGKFVLSGAPAGAVNLVVQIGRWRRQTKVTVVPCQDNALTAEQTRLPRNQLEGDIPKIAIVTGDADAVECTLRKIGIDDSEFTPPAGPGRVNLYQDNGARFAAGTPARSALTGSTQTLQRYDEVLFGCPGAFSTAPPAAGQPPRGTVTASEKANLLGYANAGGRIGADHAADEWLFDNGSFASAARWNVGQAFPANPHPAVVDVRSPEGAALASWLKIVGIADQQSPTTVSMNNLRHDVDGVNPPSIQFLFDGPQVFGTFAFAFDTPFGASPQSACGRVLFNDFHTNQGAGANNVIFPTECTPDGPMTKEEKAFEFLFFRLYPSCAP